jgi:hypothetical protein
MALLILSCAGGPSRQAVQANSPPSSQPAAVQGQALPAPELPELADQRRKPLSFPLIFLNLPEPEAPAPDNKALESYPAYIPSALGPTEKGKGLPEPELPSVADNATAAIPAAVAPTVAPAAPAAKPAAPAKPAASKAESQPKAAAKAPTTTAKAADSSKPTVIPVIPPSPASTVPLVQPSAERQPDVSRHVAIEIGSRVELPFDGTGWTYLGERDGKDGILYESRRYEGSGLVFVLSTNKTGDFLLRFQRQDQLRGTTSEELVAVTVAPKSVIPSSATAAPSPGVASAGTPATPASAGASAAQSAQATQSKAPLPSPSAAAFSPASGQNAASAAASGGQSPAVAAAAAAAQATMPDTPDGLLLFAKNELAGGRVASAIAALDHFLALYPAGMDEVFYLYGASLEQPGPLKDVKRAYDFYKRVCDDYPQSELWDKASERMNYINRHYFEIR